MLVWYLVSFWCWSSNILTLMITIVAIASFIANVSSTLFNVKESPAVASNSSLAS